MDQETTQEHAVIIACMDKRLNAPLDEFMAKLQGGSSGMGVTVLRNPGANVNGAKESIYALERSGTRPTAYYIMPHTDCAAVKLAADNVNVGASDISNKTLQAENLVKMLGEMDSLAFFDTKKNVIFADVAKVKAPHHDIGPVLVVTVTPSAKSYAEMAKTVGSDILDTYFVQALSPGEASKDVFNFAKKIDASKIVVLCLTASSQEKSMADGMVRQYSSLGIDSTAQSLRKDRIKG
ncbi:MAG: hypothetical protein KGI00_02960 [Candidatus Micrarchaeota archaeon]|nr:hypothetical protein [Candidatus Micrarchaeota archaeon]MDE1824206.1 hypothetical protein [Candidatus Micrarchaeota archaeon]MDE1849667.1 hypothetical protein [Candidatus Micrarchaeota archaeon]